MKSIYNLKLLYISITFPIITAIFTYLIIYYQTKKCEPGVTPVSNTDSTKTIIYRDTWGVPHIYAPTVKNGLYAIGWAQAQDRPVELLQNMLMGMGALSSVQGADALNSDKIALMCNLYDGSKALTDSIDPVILNHVQSFVNGINAYYDSHPQDLPTWWGKRKVDVFMVIAFSRLFLQTYALDGGLRDLKRAGINPDIKPMSMFSNQFVISPRRAADKVPILLSDIHLPWNGPYHLWEYRVHAVNLNGCGFTLPGIPYLFLGHNENVAWSITTGGPDCADAYELKLNNSSGTPSQYFIDGKWKDLKTRKYHVKIKGTGEKVLHFYDSNLGPLITINGSTAYTVKSSYANEINVLSSLYAFNFAENIEDIKKGLSLLQLFPCNFMAADNSGNIFYQCTGRIPVRPSGYDFSKPVNGTTSKTEWLGLYPASDLLQVTNPSQGYMQNCNVPPDAIMKNSPLTLKSTLPYIFADLTQQQAFNYPARDGWINSRGARALQLLEADSNITVEDAMAIANDITPFSAHRWVKLLLSANEKYGSQYQNNTDFVTAINEMKSWNFELAANSKPALKYAYWRAQLMRDSEGTKMKLLAQRIDCYREPLGVVPESVQLSINEAQFFIRSFSNALSKLKYNFGTIDMSYGDVFRIGRGNQSWPSEGGMSENIGLTTLHSVQYGQERKDHTRWAQSGQTSTGIVILSNPIQSWTCVPFGQSDNPVSIHYSDQAEKLFRARKMKSTWWTPEELESHIESSNLIDMK